VNERIKELKQQALHWSGENVNRNLYSNYEIEQKEYEKFAELIVRECIAICQDVDGEDNIDAKSGRQDCAVEIQEHFGVEE
jgi:hypothetical protein